MKSDWHTVTENKQIQQSVTLAFFLVDEPVAVVDLASALSAFSSPPPSALSCFKALVLRGVSYKLQTHPSPLT